MPRPYPPEFRARAIALVCGGKQAKQTVDELGIHPVTLSKWMRRADIADGVKPGTTSQESAELREARRRIKLLEQENEVLRRAAAYLSQAHLPKRIYPLVRELAAGGIPVTVTCRVLNLACQPYYRWLQRPVSKAEFEQARRANVLFDAHRDDPEFGYRFLADEARSSGIGMADRTARRICRDDRWWSVFGKKRGRTKKAGPPVHDDLVRRDFTANGPNRLWLADITEHATDEGKLYLRAIKDVFSRRIVGYSIDARMKSQLAVAALNNAVARRGHVAGCVLHSDRGSQFRSRKFVRALGHHRIVGSIGRVGAAGDNAAMESFFSLLQKNVLDRRTWATRQELRTAIVTWIERTYHRRRRQTALGRLTPVEYEAVMTTTALRAA
ncbi:IS3 family transposase [Streptomyces sp. BH055]|uniref:IS3 family transposase n=1 Tax=Streptomyces sp. BH055 TaxID=3401173 RepID=UPI003BB769F1